MSVLCTLVDCLSNVYQWGASWESNCTLVWTSLLALSSRKPVSIQGRIPHRPPLLRLPAAFKYNRYPAKSGKTFLVYWYWSKTWDELRLIWLHWWHVFSEVHIMWLPCQKPSSYSLLKFVYATSQLRHSLVVHHLLRKILDQPLVFIDPRFAPW